MHYASDPDAHYYPTPDGRYSNGEVILDYARLVKAIAQAGEHAMIHGHAESEDVFCADRECETWGIPTDSMGY